jgi:replicative DNA helicase
MVKVQERLESIRGRADGITGVPSGFTELDKLTAGWQPGDMIVLAGRPSMGKTAFSLNLARNAAVDEKIPVGFISLEMADHQLALRLICSELNINSAKARTGKLDQKEWKKITEGLSRLYDSPFYIDDTPGLSPMEIRARARRLKSEYDIQILFIDYIGLMEIPGKRIESQQQKIAEISRSLKALAKELEIPVMVLSQLSRAVETRPGDKRPILSDLRDSGAIEQDADVVMFIYRPGMYATKKEGKEESRGESEVPNGYSESRFDRREDSIKHSDLKETEIIIAKQRNGPLGNVDLTFITETGKFKSLDKIHTEERVHYTTHPEGEVPF